MAMARAERNTFGHRSQTDGVAPPIFQSTEHGLDPVAAFLAALVMFDRQFTLGHFHLVK
jgi:hypothetical protein